MPSSEQPLPKQPLMTFRHPLQVGLLRVCLSMLMVQVLCVGVPV